MAINPAAGQPAQPSNLVNIPRLVTAYFADRPDPKIPEQRVTFGTSGHRGSALNRAFNEWHILAITQAICAYRKEKGIDGPLFLGIDTHALSEPAFASRSGSAGGQRSSRPHRAQGRVHAHARGLPSHSQFQSRPNHGAGRRHRCHPFA